MCVYIHAHHFFWSRYCCPFHHDISLHSSSEIFGLDVFQSHNAIVPNDTCFVGILAGFSLIKNNYSRSILFNFFPLFVEEDPFWNDTNGLIFYRVPHYFGMRNPRWQDASGKWRFISDLPPPKKKKCNGPGGDWQLVEHRNSVDAWAFSASILFYRRKGWPFAKIRHWFSPSTFIEIRSPTLPLHGFCPLAEFFPTYPGQHIHWEPPQGGPSGQGNQPGNVQSPWVDRWCLGWLFFFARIFFWGTEIIMTSRKQHFWMVLFGLWFFSDC